MSKIGRPPITWEMIDERWSLVAADLISEYGLNVYDRGQMRATAWKAFQAMLGGLFAADTRIARWYDHEHGKKQPAARPARRRGR